MTPEQLELLAIASEDHSYARHNEIEAVDAARAAAASMRQPITADALTEAGWKFEAHEEAYARHTATHDIFVELQGDNPPVVEVEWTCQGETNKIPVGHADTMYDLAELVRLLGGENA